MALWPARKTDLPRDRVYGTTYYQDSQGPAWLKMGLSLTFLPYLAGGLTIRPTKTKFMEFGKGIKVLILITVFLTLW